MIPVHRSAGISNDKDVIPDVYNWDTMPQYHRTLSTSGMCNNDEEYNYYWYDFSKVSLIALGLLFVIVTICILVCSCLKCHHNPKCKHFKDNTIHESKSCYSTITCTKNVNTIWIIIILLPNIIYIIRILIVYCHPFIKITEIRTKYVKHH